MTSRSNASCLRPRGKRDVAAADSIVAVAVTVAPLSTDADLFEGDILASGVLQPRLAGEKSLVLHPSSTRTGIFEKEEVRSAELERFRANFNMMPQLL